MGDGRKTSIATRGNDEGRRDFGEEMRRERGTLCSYLWGKGVGRERHHTARGALDIVQSSENVGMNEEETAKNGYGRVRGF